MTFFTNKRKRHSGKYHATPSILSLTQKTWPQFWTFVIVNGNLKPSAATHHFHLGVSLKPCVINIKAARQQAVSNSWSHVDLGGRDTCTTELRGGQLFI